MTLLLQVESSCSWQSNALRESTLDTVAGHFSPDGSDHRPAGGTPENDGTVSCYGLGLPETFGTSSQSLELSRPTPSQMMKRMRQRKAMSGQGHSCAVCGRWFAFNADMVRHHRIHTGEKPFKCPLCPYQGAQKGNLTVHMRSVHRHYV